MGVFPHFFLFYIDIYGFISRFNYKIELTMKNDNIDFKEFVLLYLMKEHLMSMMVQSQKMGNDKDYLSYQYMHKNINDKIGDIILNYFKNEK